MKVKKGDFIELDFIAKVKEDNKIFDLTDEKVAKENNIYDEKYEYKPLILCIGNGDVVKGLDKELEDKEVNKEYKIELKAEDAFGKKDAKLFQLVNTNKFRKEKIIPYPGLQVNVDDMFGIVKTVSGNRTLVDFNHPLSGKEIIYEIKIKSIVKEDKEKLRGFLDLYVKKDAEFKLENNKAVINLDIPKEIQSSLIDKIKSLISNIKEVEFKKEIPEKEEKKEEIKKT
ncbi:MAG: FKBP-type peptidyl-prolyl cis-trans isomerase [Candidatus Nanoarchaeia archaeon]|jgi:FKBP-type peptidyl-prolyl cis-trans isomerase 2|nr:FKBP-type peptidyl-prolyl cis-trans isomerase [Candidatus Nanoarchaeia archaeon]|tara:strand:- start:16922 stop:17605 length:684 start_codon:yes stop_codon:yes gene_type:complete